MHFVGIGGAGMSALALIALRRGVAVSGCDPEPLNATDVAAMGAKVSDRHDPAHVLGVRALVYTAAVRPDHPELVRAREAGVPVYRRKDALAALVSRGEVVGIAGTHGKTTTTVMTTQALAAAGLAPTGLAGGRVGQWGGNSRLDGDALFVVEADEYDQAFLELHPTVAVVNNIEADHLECYGSFGALEAAFATFAGRARIRLVGIDDPGAARLAATLGPGTLGFGLSADAQVRITDVRQEAQSSTALVRLPATAPARLRLQVPGVHNLRNATAALAVVHALGGSVEAALEALAEFGGVGRRFERLGDSGGVTLVDDYAHHPTELVATLEAARQAFPGRRLVAVFQPHLFSRTQAHAADMGKALAQADVAVVTEIYAAREVPVAGVSGSLVVEAARAAGADVHFSPDRATTGLVVRRLLRPGDVLLTMGAGDITRLGPELAAALAAE
ncbi:MAG TPA: UDP-N-acetylmuramate--L-alanine ligase [Gemmatimonadales bacterium]|nr:UDP-N-acetylmuramate--L-alanine ligase [Gemmatimonadales bacterium]